MNISYDGIGHMSVTFPAGDCKSGQVCKVAQDGTVTACSAGEIFCGVVESVKGNRAAVQLHGFAKLHYTGTAPNAGYVTLSADGLGGVKADSSGASYLAVAVDTAAMTVTIEL